MRIVGGKLRGRRFEAPEGRGTRPTTDRMRETIASMVLSACGLDLADDSVLDAFAGSGGVGLELLSRGARHCTFCERDRRAAALLRRNCSALGVDKPAHTVLVGDVCRMAAGLGHGAGIAGAPFSVVFLDPPYAMPAADVAQLVDDLNRGGALVPQAVVVYERAAEGETLGVEGFVTLKSRKHGGTVVDVLQREA